MKIKVAFLILVLAAGILTFVLLQTSCTHEPNFVSELETVCYESQIKPIMLTSCAISGCHNGPSGEEGFDATSYSSILSFITPGDAKKSELYNAITRIYGEGMMPPDRPLSKEQRMLLEVWIEQGASNSKCVDGNDTTQINPDSVCFVQDVQPIITSNCAIAGCHDAITHEEGYNFTSYTTIMAGDEAVVPFNPGKSKIVEAINETGNDIMPPSPYTPLTVEQKDIIIKWIADGALNSNCPSASCDTAGAISYSATVWPEIDRSCVGCHNSNSLGGGVNLSSYSNVYQYATTLRNNTPILLGVIRHQAGFIAMPQGGKFEDCTIRQIELWIEQGASNN